MPAVSAQNKPWDTYPFRKEDSNSLPSSGSGALSSVPANAPTSTSAPNSATIGTPNTVKTSFREGFREGFRERENSLREGSQFQLPMSPHSRGSVNNSTVTMGSLASLASIGTLGSRASIGSVGSLTSAESAALYEASYIRHDDKINCGPMSGASSLSSSLSSSSTFINPSIPANLATQGSNSTTASLLVAGLPRDLTLRECHYLFALALDFVSVDMTRNAVSGDVSISAKFSSLQGAQAAALVFDRRTELFGNDIKTSIQQVAQPFMSAQQQTPRTLLPSRSLFAESYWSQQGPGTPLSPSTDIFGSRRQSMISPTDHINNSTNIPPAPSQPTPLGQIPTSQIPTSQFAHVSLGPISPTNDSDNNHGSLFGSGSVSPGSRVSPNAASPQTAPIGSRSNSTGAIGSGSSSSGSSRSDNSSPTPGQQQHQSQQLQQQQQHLQQQSLSQDHPLHQVDVSKIPAPNPADQNPPCNTLYVGNLPPDTSENELKELFSQQPGYRRLCFRTKQNGPMCFVEFEDEALAGKALGELYGVALSNSVKGGIRLSYSKNPLGVRSRPVRSK